MSKNNGKEQYPNLPTAPPPQIEGYLVDEYGQVSHRTPPPYEDIPDIPWSNATEPAYQPPYGHGMHQQPQQPTFYQQYGLGMQQQQAHQPPAQQQFYQQYNQGMYQPMQAPPNYGYSYNYAPHYQAYMQQQQQFYYQQQAVQAAQAQAQADAFGAAGLSTQYQANLGSENSKVLQFAKGAEIRTAVSGSVNVPPPPPGCAPTPAQLAALQGNPVVVKKQKNSFF